MVNVENAEKFTWIIGIGGSDVDGVLMHQFIGTEEQVKKHLIALVKKDKREDKECWEHGTSSLKDVETRKFNNGFYAYGSYTCYHIDYAAHRLDQLQIY